MTVAHQVTGPTDPHAVQGHPLLRCHPLTDAVALYLSTPERCSTLSGFAPAKSRETIETLYEHGTLKRYLVTQSWHLMME